MKIELSLARTSRSADRWDALPYISFDNAKEGKPPVYKTKGKKTKKIPKRKRSGIIDTNTKGAERTRIDIVDTVRFQ